MNIEQFNAIIIGTGQAGSPLASFLASKNWNVAIVEKSYTGGTCINYGCTPTKTLIGSARVAHLTERSADFGVNHPVSTIDLQKIMNRKNQVVMKSRSGSEKRLDSNPLITFIRGTAAFASTRTINVLTASGEQRILESEIIIINTGAVNHVPPVKGLKDVPFLDSTSMMELSEVPEHLVILGGSYISMEFGQLFLRLGSRVSIIERNSHILSHEDEDVSAELKNILEQEGMEFYLESEILEVKKSDDRVVLVRIKSNGTELPISCSHLMVALGRAPQLEELKPEIAGINLNPDGYIVVNEYLETNIPGIYALGDVNGGPAFTHIAYDDFRILRNNLFERVKLSTHGRNVPYCVFTDPELGRTGITEKQAREQHLNYKVAKLPMLHVARAIESGETAGFMKAIVDKESDEILGAAVLGVNGGEISSVLNLAILGKLPYTLIRDGVFAHPTFSESLNNLFSAFEDDKN